MIRLPVTRGDCLDGPRPCPHACRYRLEAGPESCALDVADEGGVTQERVAELLGVSRARAGYLEARALERLCRGLGQEPLSSAELSRWMGAPVQVSTTPWEERRDRVVAVLAEAGPLRTDDLAAKLGVHSQIHWLRITLAALFEGGRIERRRYTIRRGPSHRGGGIVGWIYSVARAEAAE